MEYELTDKVHGQIFYGIGIKIVKTKTPLSSCKT